MDKERHQPFAVSFRKTKVSAAVTAKAIVKKSITTSLGSIPNLFTSSKTLLPMLAICSFLLPTPYK